MENIRVRPNWGSFEVQDQMEDTKAEVEADYQIDFNPFSYDPTSMPPFIWPRPVTIQISLFDPVHNINNSTGCTNVESRTYSHRATYFSTWEEHASDCKRAGHLTWHMSEAVDSKSLANQASAVRGRVVDPTLRPLHGEGKGYKFPTSLIFLWLCQLF